MTRKREIRGELKWRNNKTYEGLKCTSTKASFAVPFFETIRPMRDWNYYLTGAAIELKHERNNKTYEGLKYGFFVRGVSTLYETIRPMRDWNFARFAFPSICKSRNNKTYEGLKSDMGIDLADYGAWNNKTYEGLKLSCMRWGECAKTWNNKTYEGLKSMKL